MDSELEKFKCEIDLREYAAALGYTLDVRESCRGNAVMRSGADKIIIKQETDGHYVYFSVRDDKDNGTIVDFVKNRRRISIGFVRKELRRFMGSPEKRISLFGKMTRSGSDRLRVEREYQAMQSAPRHPYLEGERRIPAAVLEAPRFDGCVRADGYQNAIFPHYDQEGICGFEKKNRNFTGFSSGGSKGLWLSRDFPEDRALVFCESAIECFSHAVLFPCGHARYASIGGRTSPGQQEMIISEIRALPAGEVIAAMNADDAGRQLAEIVQQAFMAACRHDLSFRKQFPEVEGQDWNDQLRNPSFPSAHITL